ncbi:MAG: hypothetical protein DI555_23675 [Novosphingobium pentaromativorans]|uniref:Uncharacterized protein n=1 Tax=Novosphingobium pentaromativorans TaxID=205844 RepID=A0A2W5N988_9SPHN|nr:MAG: hypothetical protein DI555_23675 [Novosphingobium pentaromativorans]
MNLPGVITPIVTGAATRFHMVQIAAGTTYVGVRLRPGTARRVLGIDLGAIANCGLVGDAALTAYEAAIPKSAFWTGLPLTIPSRNV